MVERAILMWGRAPRLGDLSERCSSCWLPATCPACVNSWVRRAHPRCAWLWSLAELPQGRIAAAEAMASARSHERLAMGRHLGILGTLGNNCPFIGLFGTVLGIIKAFADLSTIRRAGPRW